MDHKALFSRFRVCPEASCCSKGESLTEMDVLTPMAMADQTPLNRTTPKLAMVMIRTKQ